MFGRKRINSLLSQLIDVREALSNTCVELSELKDSTDATITKLTHDLREMDQLVYQMSQATDDNRLRHLAARLWVITESRMQEESKRIQSIIIPEIKAVYANHTPQLPPSPEHHQRLTKG